MTDRMLAARQEGLMKLIECVLTPVQREYLLMYHRDGFTIRRIAEICRVNPSTVSRTVRRAKQRLQNAAKIAEYCGSDD